ncbi:MAG: CBS domain-containing protein, partial [Methanobacteriaceae archaeon]|nr:CBS domain-containing protein [Methanobacteriaceae archaeon]
AKIEFTSVPHPGECEAAIKILGNIKDLTLGDIVTIGPTPVNNLGVMGEIVGRDDMDNLILLDTTTIRSIPKNAIEDIATTDLISLKSQDSIREAAKILTINDIEGAPIIENNCAIGMLTLTDIVESLAESRENLKVQDIMSNEVITVNSKMKIANAVEIMYKNHVGRLILVDENKIPTGIVTRTDLIEQITNLKNFPIMDSIKS